MRWPILTDGIQRLDSQRARVRKLMGNRRNISCRSMKSLDWAAGPVAGDGSNGFILFGDGSGWVPEVFSMVIMNVI